MEHAELTGAGATRRSTTLIAAWYGLVVMIVATIFASIDRQILLLVTEPLKNALGLSDTQIGLLNGIALSLVAAAAVFPLGWLADRVDRRALLAICVLIWSVATAACGLAQTFSQLFVCAMGIAVGEAVLGPITYALIPDLFPREKWMLANYVFFLAGTVGAYAGLALSGAAIGFVDATRPILPAALVGFDTWRLALFIVAIPGPLIALMIVSMRATGRQAAAVTDKATGLAVYIRNHIRTLIGVFVGYGLAATGGATVGTWMPVALVRVFHETPADTGIRLGVISAVGCLMGVFLSSHLVKRLRARFGDLTALRVSQIGVGLTFLLTPFNLLAVSAWQIYVIAAVQSVSMTSSLSLSPTILQYMAPRLLRGRVVALGGLIYIVFLSASPLIVGAVSDMLPRGPKSLLWAMAAVSLPCFAGAILVLRFAEGTLPQTMADAEKQ